MQGVITCGKGHAILLHSSCLGLELGGVTVLPRIAGARVAVLPRFAGDRVAVLPRRASRCCDGHAASPGSYPATRCPDGESGLEIDEARWIAQRQATGFGQSKLRRLMTHMRGAHTYMHMRCKQPSREPIPTTPQVGVSLASHFSVCFPPRDTHTVFAAKRARVHMWRLRPSISSGTLQVHLEGAGLLTAQSAEAFFFRVFFFFFPAGTLSSR